MEALTDFHLKVGDRVAHIKDNRWIGRIVHIDDNLIIAGYGATTCLIQWDDDAYPNSTAGDIQWTNKLTRLDNHE